MKDRPLDKKQALCLRGGSIYYWGGHVQSAINGLINDIQTKDLKAGSHEDAVKKMCELVEYWFPDIKTKLQQQGLGERKDV